MHLTKGYTSVGTIERSVGQAGGRRATEFGEGGQENGKEEG